MTDLWCLAAESLKFRLAKSWHASQTEMCKLVELEQEEVDGHNRDLITIGEMDTFQCCVSLSKGVDRFIRQLANTNESNPTEFR
jgi:hypothetical protein